MMRLFNRKNPVEEILSSNLHNERTFYSAFSKDVKRATASVMIESPYITKRRAREFAGLLNKARKGLKVTIYTRNPYHHDGILIDEAIEGIEILRNAGVTVIACDDMRHRKIAIIDDTILWEGSLNMLSQNGSREIMRRTSSRLLVEELKRFVCI